MSIFPGERRPNISDNTNNTIKIKNRIFATDAAPAAIPKNPKTPAIIAMIRNMIVQRNIVINFRLRIFLLPKGQIFRFRILIEKFMP